ncbi:hypothetical protein [Ruegeria lacuscaerulensis]|uniref:hypothetical protein n=1 Tax=Ruegeria lacuscaerulensis TaxID=55218 RepID=UPI001BE3F5F5|nr:hypothetical protein [Ruegeria lacuscaerulensis]
MPIDQISAMGTKQSMRQVDFQQVVFKFFFERFVHKLRAEPSRQIEFRLKAPDEYYSEADHLLSANRGREIDQIGTSEVFHLYWAK